MLFVSLRLSIKRMGTYFSEQPLRKQLHMNRVSMPLFFSFILYIAGDYEYPSMSLFFFLVYVAEDYDYLSLFMWQNNWMLPKLGCKS